MNKQLLLDNLRCIPDWPIKGVNFRDVTTLFKDKDALREIADSMYDLYKDKGITKIVGIESRGFVMSSAVAIRLNAGVVLCRKPGKLPCATIQESYAKEYGIDTIEIHADSINEKRCRATSRRLVGYRRHDGCRLQARQEVSPKEDLLQLHHRSKKRISRRHQTI